MGFSNWTYVTVTEVKAETDKAFLFEIGGEEYWIPKSQISQEDIKDIEVGMAETDIAITDFIANEKGITGN